MFPPQQDSDPSKPKPDAKGKPPAKGGKPGGGPPPPGAQQNLHSPPIGMPKPGAGIDPMSAMMGGMGDLSQFGPPPPPAPGAPLGPNGMPIGGDLASSDPGMDPTMDGSSLFRALNMQLDPSMGGQGLDDPMGGQDPQLEQLLQMLAMARAGIGPGGMDQGMGMGPPPPGPLSRGLNPSGVMNDPTSPGNTMGLNPFNVIQ